MAEWVLFWFFIDPPVVRVSVEVYRSQEACEMAEAKIKANDEIAETQCLEEDGPRPDEPDPIREYHVIINDSDPEWE